MTIYIQKEKGLSSKTDDAVRTISLDFTSWLPSGISVSSVAWESDPTGLTFSGSALATNVATITISGGLINQDYKAKCTITLSNSDIEERSFDLSVVNHKDI